MSVAIVGVRHRAGCPVTTWVTAIGIAFAGTALSAPIASEPLTAVALVSGDYAPFVAETLPAGGPSTEIAKAAFAAQGLTTTVVYEPWRRGYEGTLDGPYAGTYPYLRTEERVAVFWYSDPLMVDTLRLYVADNVQAGGTSAARTMCIPIGYPTGPIEPFVKAQGLAWERPVGLINCFRMLATGHTHYVYASELVARMLLHEMPVTEAARVHIDPRVREEVAYFLILPKAKAASAELLRSFNDGLQKLKRTGAHADILRRHASPAQPTDKRH